MSKQGKEQKYNAINVAVVHDHELLSSSNPSSEFNKLIIKRLSQTGLQKKRVSDIL